MRESEHLRAQSWCSSFHDMTTCLLSLARSLARSQAAYPRLSLAGFALYVVYPHDQIHGMRYASRSRCLPEAEAEDSFRCEISACSHSLSSLTPVVQPNSFNSRLRIAQLPRPTGNFRCERSHVGSALGESERLDPQPQECRGIKVQEPCADDARHVIYPDVSQNRFLSISQK